MEFETLTLCYIETSLIERDLLDQKHIDWLNTYHATVYDRLAPGLDDVDRAWLKEKTKSL
ncbi:MAG TPA: M24 family metallopeptidase C-terminal domain-containing protein [Sphingobacteriaceae bacterium]|nr:M24 family metallopeptidase C-terminal domain-containing protein [Sphingobacteriaceae bacterium]